MAWSRLEYKNFDFTAFFQGVQGVDIISDLKKETDIWAGLNVGFLNKGHRLLNAWCVDNPSSNIPALTLSDNNNEKRVSTYWVENGSYLKLRTIQLGYNLPKSMSSSLCSACVCMSAHRTCSPSRAVALLV